MTPSQRAKNLRAEIDRLEDEIAECEVRALFPPANCSMPQVYIQAEKDKVAILTPQYDAKRAELRALEGQMLLAIPECT